MFYSVTMDSLSLFFLDSFLIIHEQKEQCIYESHKIAYVGMCNLTNINQQWNWLQEDKLLHLRTGQCLAITRSKVAHSRKVIIANCSEAPSWTCYSSEGLLEVKNSSLFLEKRSSRVVVKKGRKYPHSWKKLDVNEKGENIHENLCSKIGKHFVWICFLSTISTDWFWKYNDIWLLII